MGLTVIELARSVWLSIGRIRRRKQDEKLNYDESERIYRIACLFDLAIIVFKDIKLARDWFREPLMALPGKTPLEFCSMEGGVRQVEIVLRHILDENF
jgi:putative toxin-antitoxin system antitoxin component (TIGR02293 family)